MLDEINHGLDSDREALLFKVLSEAVALNSSLDKPEVGQLPDNSRKRALSARAQLPANKKSRRLVEGDENQGEATEELAFEKPGGTDAARVGSQYILLTPHMIPKVDLSDISMLFIFNGRGDFTQEDFCIKRQTEALKRRCENGAAIPSRQRDI